MSGPILEMRDVSKSFFGIKALRNVDLTVYAGEIHALMGENGAGKSTLMKILSGAYTPDPGGEIRIEGRPTRIDGPLGGRAAGISIIYQELSLAPNLSVAENIYLGREVSRTGFLARGLMRAGVGPMLERLGADFTPQTLVGHLSMGQRQLVEIARALHARSKILIMDEPTTALSAGESERLFALIRQLRAEGLAIIYISHRMDEVYALGDRVTVLRDGRLVGSLDKPEIRADTIVRMMVGRDVSSFYKKDHDPQARRGPPVLAAVDIADGRRVKGCSLTVHAGEVVGLAGLIGAGRTELAHLIIGASPMTSGHLKLEGRTVTIRTPGEALDAGIAYLTEDRRALGLFLDMSCLDNINLAVLGKDARLGYILDRNKARDRANSAFATLGIRAANVGVTAGGLSRRKPAESAAVSAACGDAEGPDPRRTDAWGGCRRQVRDLFDHRQFRKIRRRHPRHLIRSARDHRHLRPRPRHAHGTNRRRDHTGRDIAAEPGRHYGTRHRDGAARCLMMVLRRPS